MDSYLKEWLLINEEMKKEGFTWGSFLEKDERVQHMSFDLYEMQKEQYCSILKATKEIGLILQKTYEIILKEFDLFLLLGIPMSAWELRKVPSYFFSYFTRLDLIVNENTIKLIEVNSDTPTGYLESSVVNSIINRKHGKQSPNRLEEELTYAWEEIKAYYEIPEDEIIYFTSYDWHEEDKATTTFIQKHCLCRETEFINIEHIIIGEDGIYTPTGNKIKYLYRLYPLEYLDEDMDEKGVLIGHQFLNHIANERVQIINPPSAFIMQSKSVMAIIWKLYEEKSSYFTQQDLDIIEKYFIPTYFHPHNFASNNIPYVTKPVFGREGGGVTIINEKQGVVAEDTTDYYYNQPKIYQKYIDMPDHVVNTWNGEYKGKLLIGSFLVNKQPCGLFLRVGEKITGNLSMFLGITID